MNFEDLRVKELKDLLSTVFRVRGYSRSRKAEVIAKLKDAVRSCNRSVALIATCRKLNINTEGLEKRSDYREAILSGENIMYGTVRSNWYDKGYEYTQKSWYKEGNKLGYVIRHDINDSTWRAIQGRLKDLAVSIMDSYSYLDEISPPVYYSSYPHVLMRHYFLDWSLWTCKTLRPEDEGKKMFLSEVIGKNRLERYFVDYFNRYIIANNLLERRLKQLEEEKKRQEEEKKRQEAENKRREAQAAKSAEQKKLESEKANSNFLKAMKKAAFTIETKESVLADFSEPEAEVEVEAEIAEREVSELTLPENNAPSISSLVNNLGSPLTFSGFSSGTDILYKISDENLRNFLGRNPW